MFAIWLAIYMDGAQCDAVAVCADDAQSCEAQILTCDAPVRLTACLNEGAAYASEDRDFDTEEPAYVLGCSTDMHMGWPTNVDLDREAVEGLR